MGWTTNTVTKPSFVVDPQSITKNDGRQWNWDKVPTSYGASGSKKIPAGTIYSEDADGLMVPRAATVTLTSLVVASNVATATKTAHGYAVGDVIYVSGSNLAYANGQHTILTVADANTFTYAATGSNATATGTILTSYSAKGITETPAFEDSKTDSLSGYGVILGGVIWENLLPDASGDPKVLSDQIKTELQATGTGYVFERYGDSRAD